MEVTRVITQELELNLEIIDATLLTVGEAVLLPTKWCWESERLCVYDVCGECKARWMDMEIEE